MTLTDDSRKMIMEAWGDPQSVADTAFNQLFCYGNAGNTFKLGNTELVNIALRIGVLAGVLKDTDPETFLRCFEKEILARI